MKRLKMLLGVLALAACGASEPVADGPLAGVELATRRLQLEQQATLGHAVAMPPNVVELNLASDGYDYGRVRQLLGAPGVTLDALLNWSKVAAYRGGGYAIAVFYASDLWQAASAYDTAASRQPAQAERLARQAQTLKEMSVSMALYALAVVEQDGLRCADAQAWRKHVQDVETAFQPQFVMARSMTPEARDQHVKNALALERTTREVRGRDKWLCQSEAIQQKAMEAALASGAAETVERDDPRTPGRDVEIVLDPAILFIPDAEWWTRAKTGEPALAGRLEGVVAS